MVGEDGRLMLAGFYSANETVGGGDNDEMHVMSRSTATAAHVPNAVALYRAVLYGWYLLSS